MRRAFTLIELLVVISIIALLIAILLPALGAARRVAKDTQGLANQQQIGRGLHVYAADNKGQLLIGNTVGQFQGNYVIGRDSPHKEMGHGMLIDRGIIEVPEAYFCPRQTDTRFQLDTPDNLWQGALTRSSFGVRPFDQDGRSVRWVDNPAGDTYRPQDDAGAIIQRLPALENYEPNDGLLADVFSNPGWIERHHEKGFNAIRVDGSGSFVNRDLFDNGLAALTGGGFSTNNNQAILDIWEYAIKRSEPVP